MCGLRRSSSSRPPRAQTWCARPPSPACLLAHAADGVAPPPLLSLACVRRVASGARACARRGSSLTSPSSLPPLPPLSLLSISSHAAGAHVLHGASARRREQGPDRASGGGSGAQELSERQGSCAPGRALAGLARHRGHGQGADQVDSPRRPRELSGQGEAHRSAGGGGDGDDRPAAAAVAGPRAGSRHQRDGWHQRRRQAELARVPRVYLRRDRPGNARVAGKSPSKSPSKSSSKSPSKPPSRPPSKTPSKTPSKPPSNSLTSSLTSSLTKSLTAHPFPPSTSALPPTPTPHSSYTSPR